MPYAYERFQHLSEPELWAMHEALTNRIRRDYKRVPGNEAYAMLCEREDVLCALRRIPPTNEDR